MKNELKVIESKIEMLIQNISKKNDQPYEVVKVAVDKSIYTLPRLKNYFTKLEKCFKLLVNKQKVFISIINYYLQNQEVNQSDLCYTIKKKFGKTVADEKIIEVLKTDFEIETASRVSKTIEDYDFNI